MSKVIKYAEIVMFSFLAGFFVSLVLSHHGSQIHEAELQDEIISPYDTVEYTLRDPKAKYVCKVFGGDVTQFNNSGAITLLFKKAGEYHVVLTASNRKGIEISYGRVVVGESDNPPSPSVETSLKDKVHAAVLKGIPEEYRGICKGLAANYRSVAAKQYSSEDELLAALAAANRETIQFDSSDMRKEAVFTTFLRSGGTLDLILIELYPDGVKNWGPVLLEIADGLE